jgi:uncharacterized glyoxalase superfamily protein PhnB
MTPTPGNLVPYLFYDDVEGMIAWYTRVFGFVEKQRWHGPDDKVANAEMSVGDTELWMDGATGRRVVFGQNGEPWTPWTGIWLEEPDDVDAMHAHVIAEGVTPEQPPQDRPYGVRTFNVTDPEGYSWGFMARIPAVRKGGGHAE